MQTPDEEFERRLRLSLEPAPQTVDRVKRRALGAEPEPRFPAASCALAGVLAVAVVVTAVGWWRRDPPAAQPDVFTAEYSGDTLVIRASNGAATLIGPPAAAPTLSAGSFRIVYEGGTE